MRRPLNLLLLLLLLLSPAPTAVAQSDPGVFALIGFSGQRLGYLDQANGLSYDLGDLAPTAAALRIWQDRLYVVNGDDFQSGEGAGLWIASLDDLTAAAHNGSPVNWTAVDLEDGTNPYDLAGYDHFVFVTLQQGGGVLKLDIHNGYSVTASCSGLARPQGIAVSGEIVCVAESNLGAGTTAYFFSTNLESPFPIEVGRNPQGVAVDASGNFHLICTGDYGEITGEAWKIDPTWDVPHTTSAALGGTPGVLAIMSDGAGQEKVVAGDEFAVNPPYLYAWNPDSLDLDPSVPVNRSGGWSLSAGNGGIYIGSAISNTVSFNSFDWSDYTLLGSFEAPVAGLAYYEMPASPAAESPAVLPAGSALSDAWPNPFNDSARFDLVLANPANVRIGLYDLLGRQILTLGNADFPSGRHSFAIRADRLAAGSYFIVVRTGREILRQHITLLR